MFAHVLVELGLAAKPINGAYIGTPESVRFQKFTIENPPKRCELCVNFLVQDYCHYCRLKCINKGIQLLGLEYGTQSQENVVGEGTTMATNNDTWITVQPRGQGWRWYGGSNNTNYNLQQQLLGAQKKQNQQFLRRATTCWGANHTKTCLLHYKSNPQRSTTTYLFRLSRHTLPQGRTPGPASGLP